MNWKERQEARDAQTKTWQEAGKLLPDTVEPSAVDIIVPTMDNASRLLPFLDSFAKNTLAPRVHFYLVNNGVPGYLKNFVQESADVTILESPTGKNLGWEGAIQYAASKCSSPILALMNDDLHIVPGDAEWLIRMASSFGKIKRVGAAGPTSNMVMQKQNVFYLDLPPKPHYTSLLIGFCILFRRDVYDLVGGICTGLPGGDDLDLSIRVERAGFHLVNRRDVFVFHHGCTTGTRVYGDYWNSAEMQERTRNTLIFRHGLQAVLRCLNSKQDEIPAEDMA